MFGYFVLGILLPSFVLSQTSSCYRCFGSSWCNNFTHPEFAQSVDIIDCLTTNTYLSDYLSEGSNLYTQSLLNSITTVTKEIYGPENYGGSSMGCVTATVHEAHEDHTVRLCLNQASTICPTIRNVVLSSVNDISPDVRLSCEGCTGKLCNAHTLVEDVPVTTTSSSISNSTPTPPIPSESWPSYSPSSSSTSESSTSSSELLPSSSLPSSQTSETSATTNVPSSSSSSCYRCFGSTWCNNFTHPDFAQSVDRIDCLSTNTYLSEGSNPYMQSLLNSIRTVTEEIYGPENYAGSSMGCVTATVHEAHEDHTVRLCLNQASTICPTIRNVVLSSVNDISPDVRLSCEGCTGKLCNAHTLVEDVPITTTSSSTSNSTPTPPIPSESWPSSSPSLSSTSESSTSSSELLPTSSLLSTQTSETSATTNVPSSSSSSCYRCFGSTWCNNFTHPEFAQSVDIIDCLTTNTYLSEGSNPYTQSLLNSIRTVTEEIYGPENYGGSSMGCVTATVHEAHEDHTVRLCLNQASIICPTIRNVVLSSVNDISPDVRLSCEGCTGKLCNTHTLVEDIPVTTTSPSTSNSTPTPPIPSEPWPSSSPSSPSISVSTTASSESSPSSTPTSSLTSESSSAASKSTPSSDLSSPSTSESSTTTNAPSSSSSSCYRCFGSTWCNNFTHPDFAQSVDRIDCLSTNTYLSEGSNLYTQSLLNSIRTVTEEIYGPENYGGSSMGCVTATVHEAHEDHTVRLCLNQASIICPTIRNVVLSSVNDISPDVRLSCEGCTGKLCNAHTLVEDVPVTTTSSSTSNSTPTPPIPSESWPSSSPSSSSTSESSTSSSELLPSSSLPSSQTSETSATTNVPSSSSSSCYRCFGSTWCNNFTHPEFAQSVDVIDCLTTNTYLSEGSNPYTQSLLNSIRTVAEEIIGPENYGGSSMGCVTATVHEAHEDHTVRLCLKQASIICPTIRNVVLSSVNDISPDVRLSCEGCTGKLCNAHTLVEDIPVTTTSPSTSNSTPTPPIPSESWSSSSPASSSTSESSTSSSELLTSSSLPSSQTSETSATTNVPSSSSSSCYRCFGSTWCNNFTHPEFAQSVDIIDCLTTNTYLSEGSNPYTQSLLNSIRTVTEEIYGPENYGGSSMGCVTATVHEAHEDHTVRLCLNQASRICPTIRNVVLSSVNDISPDLRLSCEGCTGKLCNAHTLVEDVPVTTTSSSTSNSTPTPPIPSESWPSSSPSSSSTSESSTSSSELLPSSSLPSSQTSETSATTNVPSSSSSSCYRCFGSTWCNNFTHPEFAQSVDIIDCLTTNTYLSEGSNPYTQSLLNSIRTVTEEIYGPENYGGSSMGCVTATVHEAHEDHTVRLCLNQASIICPTIRNVVLSSVNDISPDVRLSCEGCTGKLCNTHTLVEDVPVTTTSPSTSNSTTTSPIPSEPWPSSSPSSSSISKSTTASSDSSPSSTPTSSLTSESASATSKSTPSSDLSSPSTSASSTSTNAPSSSSSSCYRCFGSTWCNNFTHPEFAQSVDIIDCLSTNTYLSEGINLYTQSLLNSIRTVTEEIYGPENYGGSSMGCVTATVHEAHEDHTVRLCLNQASIICPTIRNVVLSSVNDISPDVRLSCEGCTGKLCNAHTLVEDVPVTTTSPSISNSTPTPPIPIESWPSSSPSSSSTSESSTSSSELLPSSSLPSSQTSESSATTNVPSSSSSSCYRCFGSTWCNNFTHPEFAQSVDIIDCLTTNTYLSEGSNPYTQSLLNSIRTVTEEIYGPENYGGSSMGCVTATVHEAHEDHTVRLCLNQASIICPTIRNVVLSSVNYISPDVRLSCEGCTGKLCNAHTLVEDAPVTTTSPSISNSTPTSPIPNESWPTSSPLSPSMSLSTTASSESSPSSTPTLSLTSESASATSELTTSSNLSSPSTSELSTASSESSPSSNLPSSQTSESSTVTNEPSSSSTPKSSLTSESTSATSESTTSSILSSPSTSESSTASSESLPSSNLPSSQTSDSSTAANEPSSSSTLTSSLTSQSASTTNESTPSSSLSSPSISESSTASSESLPSSNLPSSQTSKSPPATSELSPSSNLSTPLTSEWTTVSSESSPISNFPLSQTSESSTTTNKPSSSSNQTSPSTSESSLTTSELPTTGNEIKQETPRSTDSGHAVVLSYIILSLSVIINSLIL